MTLLGFAGRRFASGHRDSLIGSSGRSGASQTPTANGLGACLAAVSYAQAGVIVAYQGTPGLEGSEADGPSTAEALLTAYEHEGERFLGRLTGVFSLVILDERRDRALLAVDRMGVERLTFRTTDAGVVFGESAAAVAAFAGSTVTLRNQALFDFLLLHMVPAPNTVYENVFKLRPATYAVFESGKLRVARYWEPTFTERGGGASFATLKKGLHDALRDAVRACAPDRTTGAFLSGGLDSSSVAGMFSKVVSERARTFSIGFGVDAYDELHYARIAQRRFGFDATEYHVKPEDILTAFPLIAQSYDEPFGNSSAVPTYYCAKVAADAGITHLLAGDGGDEIFGGNERYARQQVFEVYGRIPRGVRERLIEPLTRHIPPEGGLMPLRKLRSYVDQARVPLPERLESWNLMFRTDLSTMLTPDFLASIDPRAAVRLMEEVYASAPCESVLDRLMYFDWHFTLADDDLRKVGTMCRLAGVRVSYPMLDHRVVGLSTQVPPDLKMKGLELRSFYKRAMEDFLPAEIISKKKHGFGLPFGIWLKEHAQLAELIYTHLTELKSRRIVRGEFLDQLIEDHRAGHPSYFGYAIWDLAILEAWLKAHTARA